MSCLLAVLIGLGPTAAEARPAAATAARQLSSSIFGTKTFALGRRVTHIAAHWRGNTHARVRLAFSRDGRHFGRSRAVELDELGEQLRTGETYGAIMRAGGARAVRVSSDRRLRRLSVLALTDHGPPRRRRPARAAATAQPTVISRKGWAADETLRFDSAGKEIWPAEFWPIQKLIVHHTAGQNNDPNPPATIRSIYYYHAITQGWGDIGYNFLVDEAGNVYEGRHSRDDYLAGQSPTGEDLNGNGVTGGHALNYNAGTTGIALLGTLNNQDATPAARDALERVLAWKASAHNLDPQGTSLYTNPVNGTQATFANIAGHRDVNSTECPGGFFYATLPRIRSDVAALIAGTPPPPPPPTVVTGSATAITTSSATLAGMVNPNGQATSYHFDYGKTTSYGAKTPDVSAGSATTAGSVSATLSGLARRTGYHYRLVATNANGTAAGADASFTTRTR